MRLLQLSVASASRLATPYHRLVGRWCALRQVLAATMLLGVGIAFAAPGNLDPSFSGNGLVSLKIGDFGAFAAAVVQQPDGKLVLGGTGHLHPGDFMAVRLARNGVPDATFGTAGVASADFEGGDDYAFAMIRQPDGKLVLAGVVENRHGALDVGLVRFNANGTLDSTFGTDGWAILDIDGSHDYARALIQQPDGKLVMAGEGINSSTGYYQPVFARFNTDGTLDTTFGIGGTTRVNFGNGLRSGAQALAQQLDGKLVAVGTVDDGATRTDFAVMRVTADGALDPTFDGDGMLVVDFNGNFERAGSVAIQPGGAILVGGLSALPDDRHASAALLRMNGQGRLDNSFGTAGQAVVDLGDYSELNSIVVQDDGRIVATGSLSRTSDTSEDMIVARFNANGTLDTTYGNAGVATADFGAGDISPSSSGAALVRQVDGRYVAVGSGSAGAYTVEFFAAARFDDGVAFPGLIGLTRTSQPVDETAPSVTHTARRTGGTAGAVSVHYATSGNSAQAGSDFEAAGGTLSWRDGEAGDKTITVNVIDDALQESEEVFSLTLSAPTGGAQLAASKATTTIVSEDGPGQLEITSALDVLQVPEGFFDEPVGIRVSVRRTGGSTGAVSVRYSTADGSATAGTDYVAAAGTLSWVEGDTGLKTARIVILPDSAPEGNEDFQLRLSNPTGGATISPLGGAQLVRILDNDSGFGFVRTRATVGEADRSVVLLVKRGGSVGAASVDYATASGTAIAGTDFVSRSGTLNWADGDAASKAITVNITNDTTPEGEEAFAVTLSNPSPGTTLGSNSTATIIITDDDAATLGFTAVAARVSEGGSFGLGVARTGSSVGAVSVDYATSSGTAIAGLDFTNATGRLGWADGDSGTKTITFDITHDSSFEGDETFTVVLSNPSAGATLGLNSAIPVTIADDDGPGGGGGGGTLDFLTPAATVSEGDTVMLTVIRSGAAVGAAGVDYATSSGTAAAGSDFTNSAGTLHWGDGDSGSKTIAITTMHDTTDEGVETLTVILSNSSGATLGSNTSATVSITDDDPPADEGGDAGGSDSSGGGGGGGGDRLFLLGLLLIGLARLRSAGVMNPAQGPRCRRVIHL